MIPLTIIIYIYDYFLFSKNLIFRNVFNFIFINKQVYREKLLKY